MDGTSNPGTEHVQSWLKKLKESQDRKKDEKIRRYNDVVSKLIILLIGVCIVCVIVIAALIIQNEGQRKSMDALVLANNTTYNTMIKQINDLNNNSQELRNDIASLNAKNDRLQSVILSDEKLNIVHQLNVNPGYPNVTRIIYDNSHITLYFIDGTNKTTEFTDYEFNL